MDRKDFDLRDAFPVTPEDVKRTLMNAAHSVKEEEKMKRFSIRTLAVAALIIVATTALAFAAFHSQVAEFFGSQYGKETQAWLEQGKVALPEDSVEVGSVTFQMKEVVYQNRGLYGLVAVKGEGADTALIRVDRIGVDEGELLPVKVVGYGDEKQPDGSILHSFEVSYGLVIGEGESFTLQLTAVSDTGSKEWFVKIKPEIVVAQTKLPDTSETEQQIVTDGFELLVPDEFKETGTLPVYKAQERDFGASIRPELFNQSSIAKRDQSTVRFEDGSILDWAPEAVFYNEHQGTYNVNYKEPDLPAQDTPSRTLSNQAGSLAASAKFGWYHGEEMPGDLLLHRTELSNISLESAEDQVEALLAELDVTGYTRVFALDMDVSRIKALGESENRWIRQDNNPSNAPVFDYTKVTEANEGYYLVYENALSKGSDGAFEVAAYVTHEGIVKLTLRDAYQKGDLLTTPEKLLAPETILEQLPAEIARSRFSDMTVKKIISIELVYATARDDKQGLVMTPAWLVNYYDTENEAYEAYAVFNAVDGSLLSAKFN